MYRLSARTLFKGHSSLSSADIVKSVMYYYHNDMLHELPDDQLVSFGRLRNIPMSGTREDILRRLYRNILRRESLYPVQIVYYDLEFTGTPQWSSEDVPDQEIVEVALHHPATMRSFTQLVKPTTHVLNDEAASLTRLTSDQLAREGVPFKHVFAMLVEWVNCLVVPQKDDDTHYMFVSHGGLLHDVRMLKHYTAKEGLSIPNTFFFADSYRLLRESTRNNKAALIPQAGLQALMAQFNITPEDKHHRALSDAIATWKVLHTGIGMYGNPYLSPTDQIVKKYFQWRKAEGTKKVLSRETERQEEMV